jgi:hypothetical protein
MPDLLSRGIRALFKRELLPARLRWWFAAEGTADWYRVLAHDLAPHLGGLERTRALLSELSVPMFHRRYDIVRRAHPRLPDRRVEPRAVGIFMGALYRVASNPDEAWIFSAIGGAPRTLGEHARAERMMATLDTNARWEEVTTHLGELLIALTDGLPAHLPRARPILGDICFAAGARFARRVGRAYELPLHGEANPEIAIELLRMSEYVFRVNPDHWGEARASDRGGYIEGNACPWYNAPGWNGAHCGIFGQFQSGISSVFGLKYHLAKTIPKHGGGTCRVDLKPIALRRSSEGAAL